MATLTPLGIKRTCPSCSNRFYDLNKKPATCPKCNHSYDPNVQLRARRPRRTATETTTSQQDLLLQHMAKNKPAKAKPKVGEAVEIEEFEDLPAGNESDLEELEDMDDIEGIEEIEETTDEGMDDDIALEEEDVAGEVLIDAVEDEEVEFEEEDEEPKAKKAPAAGKKKRK